LSGRLYGFLVSSADIHMWQLRDSRRLRTEIADLLRAVGNYGPSRQLSLAELRSDRWRAAAAQLYASIFTNARLDLAKTTSLAIVPDDVLWYLPFEMLAPDAANAESLLGDRVLVRYGPTASLAVSSPPPMRRTQRTGIVANQRRSEESAAPSEEMLQELEQVVSGPLRLPSPLPELPRLVAPMLDQLISFDDVTVSAGAAQIWEALPAARGSADDGMSTWFGLPHGGPERIILTGIATAAEQGLRGSRRGTAAAARPGDEIFQLLCGMMEGGARTILLTRWRTGGRTNFELVREFSGELVNSPANEAWQRACLLARESPLDAAREPRLKRSDETGESPTADHPFFWAGYMLADNSQPEPTGAEMPEEPDEDAAEPPATASAPATQAEEKTTGPDAARLPPPAVPPQPEGERGEVPEADGQ
jgi:hypothetical protein